MSGKKAQTASRNAESYVLLRKTIPMQDKALEVASLAGHILLENGAEISRVEETMERISRHYGVQSGDFFVLSNGIFTTGSTGYAKVEFIPFKGAQLERVAAVCQLSRDIEQDKYSLDEAYDMLLQIRTRKTKPVWEQLLGAMVGSAGFCIIFGGAPLDAIAAAIVGFIVWAFVVFVSAPHLSKPVGNIAGGIIGTLFCLIFHKIGFGVNLGNMIVGSLIPLIPGVPFTNGIRDLAAEDYIAGATRLLDAMMVFFCIAAGVAITFMADFLIEGSMTEFIGPVPDPLTGGIPFQMTAAFLGTLGFAVLFGVNRRNYIQCALVAAIGWGCYLALSRYSALGIITSTFLATTVVALLARQFAVWFKTPATIFLITGVFPMIPGGGIFWTAFYLVSKQLDAALQSGMQALGITAAIVLGIIIVSALPYSIFKHRK